MHPPSCTTIHANLFHIQIYCRPRAPQHNNNNTTITTMPRSRGPELAPYMRARILELRALGWGPKRIHTQHPEYSINTIKTTIRVAAKRQDGCITRPRSGRPRQLTEEDRDKVLDIVTNEDPHIRVPDLLKRVDNKVKERSIRMLLREMGKRKWRQRCRPLLTDDHARQRLQWAKRYERYTSRFWRRVKWSDECSIERGRGAQTVWTFNAPKDQCQQRDVKEKRTGKGVKKMLWGCFSYDSRSGLIPLDGDPLARRQGVTAWVILCLYSAWLPQLIGRDDIFMHDNAPVHTAYIIRNYLQELGIEVMVWPPYSPDLNPIENLWAILKATIYKKYPDLKTAPDTEETLYRLIDVAKECWHEIDPEILKKLSDSMPRRVIAVLKAEGWYTDY